VKQMNIKQASEQSGVSAPNIRFYEKEGLLTPARRQGNDYRDYTAGDVRTLKLIRMLRMLDVPLPTIKAVLRGEQPLQQALQAQQTVLEQQAAHLAAAMQFCADLARQRPQAETLDVDACLTRMEKPAVQGAFCSGWLQDYRTLAQVQHQRHFSFIPEGSINTPQEFTAALQTYAKANGMQFSLEKEGMYPEFSLDGILYKAYRNPGKYRDEICCDAASPEQLNTGLPSRRERQLRVLRILLPAAFTFAAILAAGWVATGGADWLWLAALASGGVLLGRCMEKWL
jgi:MerR family copper efflux transcriptional regulator